MIEITKDKEITISRGDTRIIPCRFRSPSRAPEDGTQAVVTLKRDYNDNSVVWEKVYYVMNGRFNIELTREDTDLLSDVVYKYDVQLRYPDGQQYTLIPPTKFKILGVVGRAKT